MYLVVLPIVMFGNLITKCSLAAFVMSIVILYTYIKMFLQFPSKIKPNIIQFMFSGYF